jgi:hypothetical protein
LAIAVLAATPAYAMRCGIGLVAEGQWTYEVLQRCGEPIERHVRTVFQGVNTGYAIAGYSALWSIVVEEWIYDLGPHRLRRLLRFENGQLVEIETLDRGLIFAP